MATIRHLGLFSKRFLYCPSETFFGNPIPRNYPDIWMPPKYALAMYWRVKKWRFSYQKTWSETVGSFVWDYAQDEQIFVGQIRRKIIAINPPNVEEDATLGLKPSNETKLICGVDAVENYGSPHFHFFLRGLNIPSTTPAAAGGTSSDAEIFYNGFHGAFYRKGTLGLEFRPAIHFQASTFRWTDIFAAEWSSPNPPLGTYGTFSYVLLGQTFSTDIYAYNSRSTVAGFANNLSMTATLEAIEYWPYDPNDGLGPIYDKDTGEQLRPFPD
jgi:hypothetical protein